MDEADMRHVSVSVLLLCHTLAFKIWDPAIGQFDTLSINRI